MIGFGVVAVGFFCLNRKLNSIRDLAVKTFEMTDTLVDIHFQEVVEERFADIVENFDE
jgi:hypothetical protein